MTPQIHERLQRWADELDQLSEGYREHLEAVVVAQANRDATASGIKHRRAELLARGVEGRNVEERAAALELALANDPDARELAQQLPMLEEKAAQEAALVEHMATRIRALRSILALFTALLNAGESGERRGG